MSNGGITACIALMVVASTTSNALSQSYFCDRPRKPYIPSYSTQKYEMENARDEVERYTRRMREYVECLSNEQNDAIAEHKRVIDEWNNAVSSFNNR